MLYEQIFKLHADLLKSIAHPKRLEIIQLLRTQPLNVSQIVEMLDLPQANISQHLIILRKAGVVKTKKEGKQIIYSIAHKNFIKASDLIRDILIAKHDPQLNELTDTMMDLVPVVHDPVCGMRVSPKTAGFALKHNQTHYYFCASGCLKTFQNNPSKYV